MTDKQYKSIKEVSDQLKINKHVIRYWDSKFEGISFRRGKNTRRFFNSENIQKLQELKNLLYKNGRHNYSLDLANLILNQKSLRNKSINNGKKNITGINIIELEKISNNLKKLILT